MDVVVFIRQTDGKPNNYGVHVVCNSFTHCDATEDVLIVPRSRSTGFLLLVLTPFSHPANFVNVAISWCVCVCVCVCVLLFLYVFLIDCVMRVYLFIYFIERKRPNFVCIRLTHQYDAQVPTGAARGRGGGGGMGGGLLFM